MLVSVNTNPSTEYGLNYLCNAEVFLSVPNKSTSEQGRAIKCQMGYEGGW